MPATMSKADAERDKRLAEALRQNLRRRKAQAQQADRGVGAGKSSEPE
jgi:hypothetical protein